jgi:hypothetical protein
MEESAASAYSFSPGHPSEPDEFSQKAGTTSEVLAQIRPTSRDDKIDPENPPMKFNSSVRQLAGRSIKVISGFFHLPSRPSIQNL